MRTMARLTPLLIPVALALAGAASAQGEAPRHPALTDRYYAGIGAFFPQTSTSAQLSGRSGAGTIIEFEDSLGMRSSDTVPAAFGRMRLGERWRVEAEYFQLNRSGERSTEREIHWGEEVYPVNTELRSRFDFSDLRVSAGYSFFKTVDKEVGVGLGLHVAAYDVSISANAIGEEQEDVTAPLPVLSLYTQFALTERWAIGGRLDRFSLSYENYDGSLTALAIDIAYQPFRHVGFGLSYRSLFISLEAEKDGRTLKAEQTFQGPMFFMNASF
jgi:hypothetical protein